MQLSGEGKTGSGIATSRPGERRYPAPEPREGESSTADQRGRQCSIYEYQFAPIYSRLLRLLLTLVRWHLRDIACGRQSQTGAAAGPARDVGAGTPTRAVRALAAC